MGGRGSASGNASKPVTANGIASLESMGAKRWTKGDKDRLYLKNAGAKIMGLDVDTYKSGNISSATRNGERISNSQAKKIIDSYERAYVDLKTGDVLGVGHGTYGKEFVEKVKRKLRKR